MKESASKESLLSSSPVQKSSKGYSNNQVPKFNPTNSIQSSQKYENNMMGAKKLSRNVLLEPINANSIINNNPPAGYREKSQEQMTLGNNGNLPPLKPKGKTHIQTLTFQAI